MIITTKVRYGFRALVEIASVPDNMGITQKDVACNQNLSVKYLDHIIKGLMTAQLITHRNGRNGGYSLALPPNKITVYMVYRAFESELCLVECLQNNTCSRQENECNSQSVWKELNKQIMLFMKGITLQDVLDGKDLSTINM